MVNKKVISDIVSKYSLGNNIEKVKWIIKDKKLIINFINDSKNLVGYVDYREDICLKEGDYGIFNTSQLIKCLNILDGDILVNTQNSKLNIADTNYDIKFNLADPAVIPGVPDIKDPNQFNVSFSISDEFITRFVKSKDALSDLDTFTVETREGEFGEELVFTVGTNITNTIEFTVENETINESFNSPIPFDSNLLKEILKANKDYHSGEIRIHKDGLLDAHLYCGNKLYTGYYLVRKKENN